MIELVQTFKLLADEQRLRALMLLDQKELCVCQLMGVLGISQPLVSRNLSLLRRAGFLEERREGKLVFYRVKAILPQDKSEIMRLMRRLLKEKRTIADDLQNLSECMEFQKKTGKCDMKTFLDYMKKRKGEKQNGATI